MIFDPGPEPGRRVGIEPVHHERGRTGRPLDIQNHGTQRHKASCRQQTGQPLPRTRPAVSDSLDLTHPARCGAGTHPVPDGRTASMSLLITWADANATTPLAETTDPAGISAALTDVGCRF